MSRLWRLVLSDRIPSTAAQDGRQRANRFFVNLRREVKSLGPSEYAVLIGALESARWRLGFLLCGYALMPGSFARPNLGHALIGTGFR
jgi:hypothetical protein